MARMRRMDRLRPGRRRGALAGDLGARRRLRRAQPRAREDAGERSTCSRCCPTRPGELHMGHVKNYTMGDVVTLYRRRNGQRVMHPMGYDAFGLPAENAAIRSGRHPAVSTRENIAAIRRQMKRMGWSIDWNARALDVRARSTTAGRSGSSCASIEAGLAYPQERRREVVPERPDGARERAGDRRALRAVRGRGRGAHARPVVLQDHRLRRPAAGRPGARAVARASRDDAAQLDRPLARRRGRRSPSTTAPSCRCSRPGPTRSSARRSSCWRRSTRGPSRCRGLRARARRWPTTSATPRARSAVERAEAREKTGVFTGRHVTNPVNGEQIPVWVADYVLAEYGTGAIMAVPGARRARLRVRPRRTASRSGRWSPRATASCPTDARTSPTPHDEVLVNSGEFSGPGRARGSARDRRPARGRRPRQGHDRLPPARLAALAPALLGLPDPDRPLRELRDRAGAGRPAARWCCPTSRTTRRAAARRWPPPRTG